MQDAGLKRTDFGHHCSKETVGEAATCPTGLLMSPTFYFIHYWTQSYANNVILLASNKLIFISPAISFWKIWIGNETNIIWVQGENHLLPFLSPTEFSICFKKLPGHCSCQTRLQSPFINYTRLHHLISLVSLFSMSPFLRQTQSYRVKKEPKKIRGWKS